MNTRTCYGEQNQAQGEIDSMNALVTNLTPNDIPLAQNIDIDQLKQADDDPLEIVVEIPVGKSKRNWNYTNESLKDIVDYTMKNTLNGFLGHQKAEDVASEFKAPVTHWIGAEMKGDSAFFRGLIDADATNLKRWVRTGRIKEVSIFGYPELKNNASTGEMDVIGYDPLSIDWTPLHRPGMPTKIVGMEMDGMSGEQLDGTFEKLREDLGEAAKTYFNTHGGNGYAWIRNIKYDDSTVIVEHEIEGQACKLYSIPFTITNNEIALGDKTEIVEKVVYEVAGEIKGGNEMTYEEIMSALKKMIKDGDATKEKIAKSLSIKIEKEKKEEPKEKPVSKEMEEITELLGLEPTGEMDVLSKVKELLNKDSEIELDAKIDKAIKDNVQGEMAQDLVKKLLNVELGATDEVISGEITKVLEDSTIKSLLSDNHIDRGTGIGGSGDTNTSSMKVKKGRI